MKSLQTARNQHLRRAFTLVELMAAMAVTALIMLMLIGITSTALEGWRVSRNQVRVAQQAKIALNQITRDLSSLVTRSGNDTEWLWAKVETSSIGPSSSSGNSPNSALLVFLTSATDRYDGRDETSSDSGGDVSTAAYRLLYRDPITDSEQGENASFTLYRQLIDPDETFSNILGTDNLEDAYSDYEEDIKNVGNFLCENIHEMSVTFLIETRDDDSFSQTRVPIIATSGNSEAVQDFRIRGNGIITDENDTNPLKSGKIISADIALTVLTDTAIRTIQSGKISGSALNRILAKESYHYNRTIQFPNF